MTVFVTGGSGFVGRAVVGALVARGDRVLALSRSPASDSVLEALGAKPVRGDLGTVGIDHLRGAEVVVHAAAHTEDWGPWSLFEEVTVRGTQRVVAAARQAGVARVVHVGTEAALFDGRPLVRVDESAPLAVKSPFPYARSKALAERAALEASGQGFDVVSIRPRFVWGEGDTTLLPALAAMGREGRFRWIDGGRALTSSTHIDNLVHALLLATERGRGGEAYFVLDDGEVPFRPFVTRYVATSGVDLGDAEIPGWVARGAAAALSPLFGWFGRRPPVTPFAAAMASVEVTLVDAKARRELGYAPRIGRDEALARLEASRPTN